MWASSSITRCKNTKKGERGERRDAAGAGEGGGVASIGDGKGGGFEGIGRGTE